MKLKKIELKNFRQFYGEQSIEFSTNKEKNITLIHAENGTGKTALLNSILWCFFEEHTINFKDPKAIINKISKFEGGKSCSVSIEFDNDEGDTFRALRSHDGKNTKFKVFAIVNGSHNEVDKPNSFINSVIPKDMAKYFFFQGEGIGKMSDSKGSSVVKQAIREILGFSIAELALRDIRAVKKEFQKRLSSSDKTGEVSALQNEIVNLEEAIIKNATEQNEKESSIELFKYKLEEAEEKLSNSDSAVIKQKHTRRMSYESQLKQEKQRLKNTKLERQDLISEFSIAVFGFELSQLALDFIDEREYEGTVPAPYNEQLVTDILRESKCICGADINPGSQAFNKIQEMLEQASDPMLETRIRKARSQLISIKNDSARAKNRFSNNMTMMSKAESDISKLNGQIQELEVEIKGAESLGNIEKSEAERKRLKDNHTQAIQQLERIKFTLKHDKEILEKQQKHLNSLDSYSSEMKKYQELVRYAAEIESVIQNTLDQAQKDVELIIIKKVNSYLKKFVRQDYRAKLDKTTFDIRLVDKYDSIVPESNGQALLLSLTFISSLIELSRERKNAQGQILTPGAIAPLVIDAPFGELDNKYKGHVAKAIPSSVEQVIFLLSSSHWEGTVEDNIRDKIGKEYNLVLEETSDQGAKLDNFIKILGNDYETVRYTQPVDRTIIEEVGSYA